jgi:hypothetical protein
MPNIKTHVQLYVRGAVQLKASYVEKDVHDIPLEYPILQGVYVFLSKLFDEVLIYSSQTEYNAINKEIKSEKKFEDIPNMVPFNGKSIKKPKMCQNRKAAGGHDLRPVPYSFNGKCPEEGYYVPPRGIQRTDTKTFEPCCYKLKPGNTKTKTFDGRMIPGKDSIERYRNIILYGYPDAYAGDHGEPTPVYGDSAVYIPGTKIIENRAFPGLKSLSKKELLACVNKNR